MLGGHCTCTYYADFILLTTMTSNASRLFSTATFTHSTERHPTSCSLKPKRDAKRSARSTLRGSSSKVTIGDNGVRMIPARRSSRPLPYTCQYTCTHHHTTPQYSAVNFSSPVQNNRRAKKQARKHKQVTRTTQTSLGGIRKGE